MAKISNYVGYGLHADRPAAGAPGALYFESDTSNGYRDNGASWDAILLGAPPRTVITVTATTTLVQANALVMVTAGSPVVTLPDPVANKGLLITMKEAGGVLGNVKNPDGSDADANGQRPWNGLSDGVQWWNTDF